MGNDNKTVRSKINNLTVLCENLWSILYYLAGPLLALSSGSSRIYWKSTDKLLCEVCSLSPFYGLKLQIEPHSTRCHYLLMTYLTFKMIPDLYEIMYCESIANCESTPFVTFCVNLSHLLVCFNSSANFVIYLLGGEKFRRAWCQTYLCRKTDSSHTRFVHFFVSQLAPIRVPGAFKIGGLCKSKTKQTDPNGGVFWCSQCRL